VSEQWKTIGFQGTDPSTDFRGMGVLGLDNLLYFAEAYSEVWRKIVTIQAERKERDYPVAVAGINVTQMMYDIFKINQQEDSGTVYSVLFDHPKSFHEIYVTVLRVLDNTWDEMNASYMDFPKVIAAVKKQISDVLAGNPSSIEQFNRAALWTGPKQQTQQPEEETHEPEPVKALRSQMRAELLDVVKQQKVTFLQQGNWFKVYKPKNKQPPFMYFKLQENCQDLSWGFSQTSDQLPTEMQVLKIADCTDVLTGANSPLFSKQKKISPQDEEIANLTFSIMLNVAGRSIDCVAVNKEDFVNWSDGLRVILSDKVENPETLEELKSFVNLEVAIKLLELEAVEIPQEAPKVPVLPDNYNFTASSIN